MKSALILPPAYRPLLGVQETERAIKALKDFEQGASENPTEPAAKQPATRREQSRELTQRTGVRLAALSKIPGQHLQLKAGAE